MEVTGRHQAPPALLPEGFPVPTEREAGWAPETSRHFGEEKNLFRDYGILKT